MSSSNLVRIAFIPETVYGETPAVGDFFSARFTSDSLSGTPETTESQQIRTDRLSSGQVVTGLTLSGEISGELSKEEAIDLFIESAMHSSWVSSVAVNADLDIDATLRTITRASGDFNADVVVGDIISLTGFTNVSNNTEVMVTRIISATQIGFAGPADVLVTENSTGNSFKVADKIEIGVTKKSFSIEKAFLDLSDKAINYKGMIVSTMSMNIAYGDIINYSFGFSGNDYKPVNAAVDFLTDGRTITPAATTNSMNGSIDMQFLAEGSTGTVIETGFCIQSVEFSLNNNLNPQNCIGRTAPKDYTSGTAQIENSISAYLSDENWNLLGKKLTQESFELGFIVKNVDGFYGFFMPAVQISGDDPASAGINTDVILSLTGTSKVGPNGEKSLVIYRG